MRPGLVSRTATSMQAMWVMFFICRRWAAPKPGMSMAMATGGAKTFSSLKPLRRKFGSSDLYDCSGP